MDHIEWLVGGFVAACIAKQWPLWPQQTSCAKVTHSGSCCGLFDVQYTNARVWTDAPLSQPFRVHLWGIGIHTCRRDADCPDGMVGSTLFYRPFRCRSPYLWWPSDKQVAAWRETWEFAALGIKGYGCGSNMLNGIQRCGTPGTAPYRASKAHNVTCKGLSEPSAAQNTPIVALFHTGRHCRRLN